MTLLPQLCQWMQAAQSNSNLYKSFLLNIFMTFNPANERPWREIHFMFIFTTVPSAQVKSKICLYIQSPTRTTTTKDCKDTASEAKHWRMIQKKNPNTKSLEVKKPETRFQMGLWGFERKEGSVWWTDKLKIPLWKDEREDTSSDCGWALFRTGCLQKLCWLFHCQLIVTFKVYKHFVSQRKISITHWRNKTRTDTMSSQQLHLNLPVLFPSMRLKCSVEVTSYFL